jgi:hypothetical protein
MVKARKTTGKKTKGKSKAGTKARTVKAGGGARPKTYTLLVLATLSENDVIRDVRAAIKREVSLGGETNFRWVPADPPMALRSQQWQATGDAIVDNLQRKYPKLVVKRQEIGAHYKKELTSFREFLTKRITS